MTCLQDELPLVTWRDGEDRDGRRLWQLTADVTYRLRDGSLETIPKGFRTDFTSTPRLLWRFEPPTGEAMFGALPHDWFYASMRRPRAEADLILLQELEDAGVAWLKRSVLYRGVRTFGAGGYGRPEEYAHAMALLEARRNEPVALAAAFASLGHCVAP